MRAKSILLSKTFWVNLVAALTMVLEESELTDIIPDAYEGHIIAFIAIVNIILRVWTVQPVAMKLPDSRDTA